MLPKGRKVREIPWLAGQGTCQPGPHPAAPEQGKPGRLRDHGQVQPGAQISRQVRGDKAGLRSSLEVSPQLGLDLWGP